MDNGGHGLNEGTCPPFSFSDSITHKTGGGRASFARRILRLPAFLHGKGFLVKGLNVFKAGFIAIVGIYGIFCAASPGTYRFLDRVDLVFHEAGHPIFGLFGEFIGILGGSLMQVLIPAGIVVYFAMHRQKYSAAVTLFWVGQSLFNVSVYARDARARALPLLGGEETLHDWTYILAKLGLIRWDQAVGNLIYALGLLALAASILGGFYFSRDAPKEE